MTKENDDVFHINVIRSIVQAARDCYPESGEPKHDTYLSSCFEILQGFLRSQLADTYLFSAMTLKPAKNKPIKEVAEGKEVGDGYDYNETVISTLKPIIDGLLHDINAESQGSMSLTEHLLIDHAAGRDLFFCDRHTYRSPVKLSDDEKARIVFFPLSTFQLDSVSNAEQFLKLNKIKVKEFQDRIGYKGSAILAASLLWRYTKMYRETNGSFVMHFIRPSLIEWNHNVMLSLATTRGLHQEQLSFIYLLMYRVVGQMALELTREVVRLRRLEAVSYMAHALKTEINEKIRGQIQAVRQLALESGVKDPDLNEAIDSLETHTLDLFGMASLATLLSKIDESDTFIKSGLDEKLLCRKPVTLDVSSRCDSYNQRHVDRKKIQLEPEGESTHISMRIESYYFSRTVLELFLDTVFENVNRHGRWNDNNVIDLRFRSWNNGWVVENATWEEWPLPESERLTGNLHIFQKLISGTNSGALEINTPPKKNTFSLRYETRPNAEPDRSLLD